jgi:hypothetical protein
VSSAWIRCAILTSGSHPVRCDHSRANSAACSVVPVTPSLSGQTSSSVSTSASTASGGISEM